MAEHTFELQRDKLYERVRRNKYGFYELKHIPTEKELSEYYSTYYQDEKAAYRNFYSDEELRNIQCGLALQEYNFKIISERDPQKMRVRVLDVGCGEGFFLEYFRARGCSVCGIDYNTFGCEKHNPRVLPYILQGDSIVIMAELVKRGCHFDYINLDNVLEHMINPKAALELCAELLSGEEGILSISVPNDFSIIHQALFERGAIQGANWVFDPDHISYFNQKGLSALLSDSGLEAVHFEGTFPIDLNLFNPDTNYYADKSKGQNCHVAQVQIENLLADISVEKLRNLYTVLGELGVGRQINCYCKLRQS